MKLFLTLIFSSLLFVSDARTEPYNFKILRVVDGDTIMIDAPFLPKELKQTLLVRIHGVDTPEKGKRAKCYYEENRANQAKLFVELEIRHSKTIQIELMGWDKYGGRVLGDVLLDGVLLSRKLIANNYAVPYSGRGKKKNWCVI